jgi:hypothetical protein
LQFSCGFSTETFTDTAFNYDYTVSPRAWLEYRTADDVGIRATYFQFDQAADTATGSPPANGFGAVFHPVFGLVNIGSPIPGDVYTTQSGLEVYSIDLEVTKWVDFSTWQLMGSVGLRYASVEQSYEAQLRDALGTLVGSLDNQRRLDGFGPTLGVEFRRPLTAGLSLFGTARGSLLFGEQSTTFVGGEDLDLITPLFTFANSEEDDLLPVGELQLGVDWWSAQYSWGQFFVHGALEAQLWSGAGSAVSEEGSLGFFGANVGLGFAR